MLVDDSMKILSALRCIEGVLIQASTNLNNAAEWSDDSLEPLKNAFDDTVRFLTKLLRVKKSLALIMAKEAEVKLLDMRDSYTTALQNLRGVFYPDLTPLRLITVRPCALSLPCATLILAATKQPMVKYIHTHFSFSPPPSLQRAVRPEPVIGYSVGRPRGPGLGGQQPHVDA